MSSSLPTDWRVTPLGEHVRITSGESPSLFEFVSDGTPYFKVEQLGSSNKYLGHESTPYQIRTAKTVPRHSVAFAKRGAAISLNRIRIFRQDSYMDTNLMALTPSDDLSVEYLYYVLGHIGLWQLADTTSVPQINNKHIQPLPFPLPPIKEQRAIAEALSDVDTLLTGLDRLIAKKRDLKQAAMQQLLTGQTRLPGFDGSWKAAELNLLCSMKSGESITSEHIDQSSTYPCYGGNGIRGFTARFTHEGSYVLIGRQGALCGNVVVANGKFFASEHAVVVSARAAVDVRWLAHVLKRMNLNRYSESSAQPGLSASKILKLSVSCPPTEAEQSAIAAMLAEMDDELGVLETRLKKTRALKQAMMQELLTGRIRLI